MASTSRDLVAELNARDVQENTPFQYAAENEHTEVVNTLLKHKGKTGPEDETYQQAAESAAARGHLTTVKLLISPLRR